jgi:hypothetical protein
MHRWVSLRGDVNAASVREIAGPAGGHRRDLMPRRRLTGPLPRDGEVPGRYAARRTGPDARKEPGGRPQRRITHALLGQILAFRGRASLLRRLGQPGPGSPDAREIAGVISRLTLNALQHGTPEGNRS